MKEQEIHENMSKTNTSKFKVAPIIESLDSFMNQKDTVVAFTTNLPVNCINDVLRRHERLDTFYLGPPSKENITKIVQEYFPKCSLETANIPERKLMPSDIHYYCKISSSLEECIKMLETHT